MFGYILPVKSELRLRELEDYQACYCGLCRSIKHRFGELPRLALNYDCTFLAMLLSSVKDESDSFCSTCVYRCFRGKRKFHTQNDLFDYSADVNILLAYYHFLDDWKDERKLLSLFGLIFFRRSAKKAAKFRPELDSFIQERLFTLSSMEKSKDVCSIDEFADPFASLMRDLFSFAPRLSQTEIQILSSLGYNLGRWIYLFDAWDDREKDASTHSFNPILFLNMKSENVAFLLHFCLSEAEKALDLLPEGHYSEIIDNTIRLGCRSRTENAFKNGAEVS